MKESVDMTSNKAFTVFGGTGDLTFRKLMPAQYNMTAANAAELILELLLLVDVIILLNNI